ncbi:tRNA 2-thiocytidine(32) synthetase TtcA [Arhodomonas aquaeolei]|uniref:tRNA 2-thiocytidine(32) synthetase TtcA n=1 Tax=Arhodomonas aquaeolei TaxID=2369 RepID=UPI00216A738D|nr:tRNA 2-thiocytidine(32) synthetase TtcA [Arhodomonas aquaeolei]MCS4504392.1 tRNA 2-thiocytidine(32) synthetase TtcA [Arhodomonas aquaeolei]
MPVNDTTESDTLAMNLKTLERRLTYLTGKAIREYGMIEDGDRVMVCLSGGKDSYTLLEVLRLLQRRAPVRFELVAVNLDQKQPGFPEHVLPAYLDGLGVDYRIVERDTYSTVKRVIPEGQTMCSLCSRLRRGILYGTASELGATKIALGHHRDDMLETLFLNMFYGGRLAAMAPKLKSNDGRHVVIRPLAHVPESYAERYSELKGFPIIPCSLCGSQPNLKRQAVKAMLRQWEAEDSKRLTSMLRAMQNVQPSQLADTDLFDFHGLRADGAATDGGEDPLAAVEQGGSAGEPGVVTFGAPAR